MYIIYQENDKTGGGVEIIFNRLDILYIIEKYHLLTWKILAVEDNF